MIYNSLFINNDITNVTEKNGEKTRRFIKIKMFSKLQQFAVLSQKLKQKKMITNLKRTSDGYLQFLN